MKNDVVRWNAVQDQKSQYNNNNNSSDSTERRAHVAKAPRQHVATLSTRNLSAETNTNNNRSISIRNDDEHHTAFAFNANAIKCDNKNFNKISFLVKKRNHNEIVFNSRRRHSLASSCTQQLTKNHHHLRQRQPSKCSSRRTLCRFSLTGCLLACLQISAVMFLCNFNIGFALGAKVGVSVADLPYELDYDNTIEDNSSSSSGTDGHYTHTWAVHIPDGDSGLADEVARDHGFVNLGKILGDHYHFAHHKVSKRSLTPASSHQTRLDDDHRVHWAKQQKAKSRRKRDFIRMRPSRTSSRALSLVDAIPFSDPKWPQMWYLNRGGGLDMNVIPAWKEGITGKGIVVTILDDGLESDHPDIEHNYDPKASYDVNSHDDDPMPHYDMTDSNRHGTRCAGEVAATANNTICAVGIAFGASVGGVRMLDGDVTDAVEARSLSLNPQHIDIYSASWGPDDDGKTVDGPGELASRAFIEGVTKGRNGKGSIFIWASGNGGRELDNCNCDGYTNSIWTLSISSATEEGHVPWYSEKCSSTLATTYSSGGQTEKQVVTTDLHHSCTVSHTGTSASAPLAAGIAALVLESNQNLTWRDLQHIVVRTAKPANLKDQTWSNNGVGRRISHSFGYGLMDAAAMVKVARTWKTVPEQQRCEINAPHVDKVIPPKSYITLQLTVKHCLSVNFLEHVQAKITLTSQRRGDIQLYLKSPAGTVVTLLTSRVHDVSRSGFNQWPFMSVHTWGESPHGNWHLEIHNEGRYMAQITQWDLIFYGTETSAQPDDPAQTNPEQFSPFGNDMEHNDIEYDSSGQWRNMQQVRESRVTNDKTNTACLKTTIDQRCLACAPPTYLFNGRCYDECPRQTYPVVSNKSSASVHDIEPLDEGNDLEIGEELQSMDRKRRRSTIEDDARNALRSCESCDVTCFRCYGPLNSQCRSCFPGSQLRKQPHSNETYCYVYAERSSGNSQDGEDGSESDATGVRSDIAMFLIIIVPAILLISLIVFLTTFGRNWQAGCWRRGISGGSGVGSANYTYDRVVLLPDDETEEAEVEAEAEAASGVAVYVDDVATAAATIPAVIDCVMSESSDSEEDLFSSKTST